jgi:hypothetical protein
MARRPTSLKPVDGQGRRCAEVGNARDRCKNKGAAAGSVVQGAGNARGGGRSGCAGGRETQGADARSGVQGGRRREGRMQDRVCREAGGVRGGCSSKGTRGSAHTPGISLHSCGQSRSGAGRAGTCAAWDPAKGRRKRGRRAYAGERGNGRPRPRPELGRAGDQAHALVMAGAEGRASRAPRPGSCWCSGRPACRL